MRVEPARWEELETLIDRHCEAVLTRAEALRLEFLLRGDREARRRFIGALYLDGALRWERAVGAAAPFPLDLAAEGPTLPRPEPRAVRSRLVWQEPAPVVWLDRWQQTVGTLTQPVSIAVVVVLIVATMELIAFLSSPLWRTVDRTPVARLTTAVDCRWAEGATRPQPGEPLAVGDELRLASGMTRIAFFRGTTVALEGPARFVVQSDNSGRLYQGRLVARTPHETPGFAVETPGGKVTDLGTVFAVSVVEGQAAEVHVLEGLVETERLDRWQATGEKCRVTQGLAVRFAPERSGPLLFAADTARFTAVNRLASGVVRTEDHLRFREEIPASLVPGVLEDDEVIHVFLERRDVVLGEPLEVLVPNSAADRRVVDRRQVLPPGSRVDCYLLHFDPKDLGAARPPVTLSGSLTFDRPVLGVIAADAQLQATDAILGSPRTKYATSGPAAENRGVETTGAATDIVQLTADDRTLSVQCHHGQRTTDQMRILVASEDR